LYGVGPFRLHLYHVLEVHRQTEERIKAKRAAVNVPIPVDAVVSELLHLAQAQVPIELETTDSEILETAEESSDISAQDAERGRIIP
jgi:hypothetical protein